ncbi:hypothetical protein RMCBS344292_12797 [Rhizopus microsporus]|nr:hypothetical protein RMCBS344292_12797 [Rhizopus microsporus]
MSKIRRIEAILSKTQHSNQNKNNSNDDNDASRNSIREIIQRRFLKEQEGKNNNNEFSLDKNLFINLTRAFLPYGVYLQENESRERLIVRRLEYADLDDEFDSIEDAVTATVIQSKSSIQNIEDWVQSIAGIDKDLSDRLLKLFCVYPFSCACTQQEGFSSRVSWHWRKLPLCPSASRNIHLNYRIPSSV